MISKEEDLPMISIFYHAHDGENVKKDTQYFLGGATKIAYRQLSLVQ